MNSLSWLLYFADVCSSFGAVIVMSWVFLGLFTLFFGMAIDFDNDRLIKILLPWKILLIATSLCIFIPEKETVYAIAVSETGEEALKSNLSTKAQKAIEKWIDSQLGDKK